MENKSSIVLKCELNKIMVNAILDTGTGKSLIDIGTAEKLNLITFIQPSEENLFDASGNKMDKIGTVCINVELVNSRKLLKHTF